MLHGSQNNQLELTVLIQKLARTCGVPAVGVRAVDCWQTTQWPLFSSVFFFPPCSSIATFSHRRSGRIKKLIQRKLLRMPKNLGVHPFPDPVAATNLRMVTHQGWSPTEKEGVVGSKKLFRESCLDCPQNQGQTPFQTPSANHPRMVTHLGWSPIRRKKESFDQKNYLAKVAQNAQKTRGTPLSRSHTGY